MAQRVVTIPVSVGELLDKMSILLIKEEFCTGVKLARVRKEMALLKPHVEALGDGALAHVRALHRINRIIWTTIDRQSELLGMEETDGRKAEEAALARDVVIYNQERFRLKQAADKALGSAIQEVKQHARDIPRPKQS